MTENTEKQRISEAIDAAVEAAGGKQSFLADRLGCAQQTVSKLRSGEIPMTADWALRLAAAVPVVPATRYFPPLAALTQPEAIAS